MSVTFILRSEPDPGEVTVRLYHDGGSILGSVSAPGGLEGSHTAAEADRDGRLGVHQALASAIELAATHGGMVGVIDKEGVWKEEWGELGRESR